jgi:hypothetical protein
MARNRMVEKPHLIHRLSLLVTLPMISEKQRLPESAFWRQYEGAQAIILGALLTAVSASMRELSQIRLAHLPRMADFALWASAGEQAVGLGAGTFMAAYSGNMAAGNELALEASPVGKVVMEIVFAMTTPVWSGTAAELLEELEKRAEESTRRLKAWPKSPRALAGVLRRLAPNLRKVGVAVEFSTMGRDAKKRRAVTLGRSSKESIVPTVPDGPSTGKPGFSGDDGDANGSCGDATGKQTRDTASPCGVTVGAHGDDGDADMPACSDEETQWTA